MVVRLMEGSDWSAEETYGTSELDFHLGLRSVSTYMFMSRFVVHQNVTFSVQVEFCFTRGTTSEEISPSKSKPADKSEHSNSRIIYYYSYLFILRFM